MAHPSGSPKHGIIPNYFFPYRYDFDLILDGNLYASFLTRNARDHVQPFVLVQFNKLPLHRLVTVTCYALAPGIENTLRGMRGMVSFQMYRALKNGKSVISVDDQS